MLKSSSGTVSQGWQKSVSSEVPNSKKKTYTKLIYLPLAIIILILAGELIIYQKYRQKARKISPSGTPIANPTISKAQEIDSAVLPPPTGYSEAGDKSKFIQLEGVISKIMDSELGIYLERERKEIILKLSPDAVIIKPPEVRKSLTKESLKVGDKVFISALQKEGYLQAEDIWVF